MSMQQAGKVQVILQSSLTHLETHFVTSTYSMTQSKSPGDGDGLMACVDTPVLRGSLKW